MHGFVAGRKIDAKPKQSSSASIRGGISEDHKNVAKVRTPNVFPISTHNDNQRSNPFKCKQAVMSRCASRKKRLLSKQEAHAN